VAAEMRASDVWVDESCALLVRYFWPLSSVWRHRPVRGFGSYAHVLRSCNKPVDGNSLSVGTLTVGNGKPLR